MSTTDLANYGTVLSYAVHDEDNEITFTDYGGFVLSIKGKKLDFLRTLDCINIDTRCSTWKKSDRNVCCTDTVYNWPHIS